MPEPVADIEQRSSELSDAALTECVEAAIAAPSIHNSQPWQFRLGPDRVDVFADWSRRLEIIDPSGREMLISVGAAVFNLRLAMRQRGRIPRLVLYPEPAEPDLVAQVIAGGHAPPAAPLSALAAAIPRRHTNRLPFAPTAVPPATLEVLQSAARLEGATLSISDAVARNAILSLVHTAEHRLRAHGEFRGELNPTTRATRRRRTGMPPTAFGPWQALEALPLRDFGLMQPQLLSMPGSFEPFPTIVVLSCDGDDAEHWLRSGQALQRVLLTATTTHLAATPVSQPLEIAELRELVSDTAAGRWAQVILRLGYAAPTTPTPRRPLAEVLLPGPPGAG